MQSPFKKWYWWLAAGLVVVAVAAVWCLRPRGEQSDETADTADQPEEQAEYLLGIRIDTLQLEDGRIREGWSLSLLLSRYGLPARLIDQTARVSRPVFDVRHIQSGHEYIAMRTLDSVPSLRYFLYKESRTGYVVFDFSDSIEVYRVQKEVQVRNRCARGTVSHSLWKSLYDNGDNTTLANPLSDIYAWQIDFFGIQKGDAYQVLYDEYFVDDSVSVGIGEIHAAVFRHNGKDFFAFPFEQDGYKDYFDENGINLRKAFLKAPLKYSRISSHFNPSRLHPVLKIRRPHLGVDYAAPTGTPVMSIGSGVVTKKAFQKGGAGNYVTIRHNGTYTTTYMHLSRFAKGLAVGQQVSQGEVIGYVGATGLATGPHLDFRVFRNGQAIDPLKMESPPSTPLKEAYRDSFELVKNALMARLGYPTDSLPATLVAGSDDDRADVQP